jgi:hypothetical protein
MKKIIAIFALATAIAAFSPIAIAADPAPTDKAATTEGKETSDRTPEKKSETPAAQVDTTKSGETSDRTPAKTEAKAETTAPDTTAK